MTGHVGSNGDEAHLPADADHSGFMSKESYIKSVESSGNRTTANNIDIQDLPAGLYEGANIANTPNPTDIQEIDIRNGKNGRKQIFRLSSWNGQLDLMTLHTNGGSSSNPLRWTTIPRICVLWEGTASNVNTEIELAETAAKYSYLEYHFITEDGYLHQGIGYRSSAHLTATNIFDGSDGIAQYKMKITLVENSDGKKLKITANRYLSYAKVSSSTNITMNESQSGTGTKLLKLVRVIGVVAPQTPY